MQTFSFGLSALVQPQILLSIGYVAPRIAVGNRQTCHNAPDRKSHSDQLLLSSLEEAIKSVDNLVKNGVWDRHLIDYGSNLNSKSLLVLNNHTLGVSGSRTGQEKILGSNSRIKPFLYPNYSNIVQKRWFKAKSRQTIRTGEDLRLGERILRKGQNIKKYIEDLRKKDSSVEKIFPDLVESKDLPPEEKKRIQVAFMEGYVKGSEKTPGNSPKKSLWFKFILTTGIVVTVLLFLESSGKVFRRVLIGNRSLVSPEEIDVTFADVRGVEEAKQELQEIIEFLRNPEKFSSLGGKLPKGVLLVGPPGTGKTLLARAVAGEADVPFFHAAGPEFDEILVGQGARRVRDLFATAKMKAPCVIFIDEIDSIGGKRTNSVLHPYANQTINQLLTEMDGFRQNEGVIVLGATNRRDDLDKALLRPGRFDVEVQVPIPDLKGRQEILDLYLSRIKLARDVDAGLLAKRTIGFTGADLENLVNQAALRAAIENQSAVSMKYFESARDKVIMGPERKNKIPDAETNRNTAYHEGGHALVALYTKEATPLHKVTILPRGRSLGHTAFIPDKEDYGRTKAQLLATMDCAMGGRAAEELIFGSDKVTSGALSDLKGATDVATSMVKHLGMSEKVGVRYFNEDGGETLVKVNEIADATSELIDSEIKRLLQESYDRAKNILKSKAEEHRLLAEALLKFETLDAEDVKLVIQGKDPQTARR